jgi:DNA-directed RNA polymerase subunit F
MCHTINWEDRLEIDNPTIPVADIVLEKLQIVEINPKDIKDLVILLLEHGVGHTDQDMVNGNYMSELLSKDWGFHYTATTNLKKILDLMGNYVSLSNDERDTVTERVNTLLDIIEKKQKSLAWRMRAQIGAKRKWYTDVAEDQTPTRVE